MAHFTLILQGTTKAELINAVLKHKLGEVTKSTVFNSVCCSPFHSATDGLLHGLKAAPLI
jgi:hypothetical protein